jgi:type I restriction enzyme, S subunit
MSEWPMVALGEVASIVRTTVAPSRLIGDAMYVGLEHIPSGGRMVRPIGAAEADIVSTKFKFQSDDVLFGKLRPYLAKVAIPEFEGVWSTDIIPIRPSSALEGRFLMWYLLTPEVTALAATRSFGANLPRLSPNELATFELPLPPLAEQRRIAAILDQADQLHTRRRESVEITRNLEKSLFLDMFAEVGQTTTTVRELAAKRKNSIRTGLSEANCFTANLPTMGWLCLA